MGTDARSEGRGHRVMIVFGFLIVGLLACIAFYCALRLRGRDIDTIGESSQSASSLPADDVEMPREDPLSAGKAGLERPEEKQRMPVRAISSPVEIELVSPAADETRESVRFGIYRVKEPAGLRDAERTPLETLVLPEHPIISEGDLVWYDWDTHTVKVRPGLRERLNTEVGLDAPFVVVAKGTRCYLGAFSKSISSYIPRVPRCGVDRMHAFAECLPQDMIRIDGAPDDERIREALDAAGKLKRPAKCRIFWSASLRSPIPAKRSGTASPPERSWTWAQHKFATS